MKEVRAFSPCHITGFFQIVNDSENPLYIGSKGAGVSLSHGVETCVKVKKTTKNSVKVRINGLASSSSEVTKYVLDTFLLRFKEVRNNEVIIEHKVQVPIGAGYGTSGAAALSLALALNETFKLGMSKIEAAQLAHIAEVRCKTGLGTVIAETFGGVEVRVIPGAPGIGDIKSIPVSGNYKVACLTFQKLSTKKILSNKKICERINHFGGKLVNDLLEAPNITNFLTLSRQFAEMIGMIPRKIKKILTETDNANFICSMPMFGEAVFTLTDSESLKKLLKIFYKYNSDSKVILSDIDFKGARIVK